MLLPLLWALHYQGPDVKAFFLSIIITLGEESAFVLAQKAGEIGHQEGFVVAAFGWILAAAFGSLPFLLAGACPSLADAYFETMSGFTTTGATIFDRHRVYARGFSFRPEPDSVVRGHGHCCLVRSGFSSSAAEAANCFARKSQVFSADRLLPRITETAKAPLGALYISV